ncbi:MAG: type IV pilus assembly protein PilM [bacterium]|nr:type IV pilus assembly protein PilM [bacterium]
MRNLLSLLPKRERYLGIDIGTASIKAVELASSKGKVELKNYGSLEVKSHLDKVNDAIQTSSLEAIDFETANLIKTLVDEIKPATKEAVASLPAFSAFTSLVELPDMSESETAQAMEYQAKSLVPMSVQDTHLDWFRVGRGQDSQGVPQQQLFLIAVPKRQIDKYQAIFSQAGLNLKALELETVALARVLTRGDGALSLIVDIGARSTAIAIAQNGLLLHSAQADFAGNSLTQAVSRGLGINVGRAEELKKQKGLMGKGGEYEVSTLMLPYLDVILNEAKRVKESYEKTHSVKVGRAVLAGGGANLLGIEKRAFDQLQIPVVKAEPFEGAVSYPPALAPSIKQIGAPYSVALGLGVRDFNK